MTAGKDPISDRFPITSTITALVGVAAVIGACTLTGGIDTITIICGVAAVVFGLLLIAAQTINQD